jgi:hypothetical protein
VRSAVPTTAADVAVARDKTPGHPGQDVERRTTIVGGVIFSAAARRGRLRLAWSVVGAYLLVAVLHAAFDAISGVIGYVVVSILGLVPLVWLWMRADGGGVLPRNRHPGLG